MTVTQLRNKLNNGYPIQTNDIPSSRNLRDSFFDYQLVQHILDMNVRGNFGKFESQIKTFNTISKIYSDAKTSAIFELITAVAYVAILVFINFMPLIFGLPGSLLLCLIPLIAIIKSLAINKKNSSLKSILQSLLQALIFPKVCYTSIQHARAERKKFLYQKSMVNYYIDQVEKVISEIPNDFADKDLAEASDEKRTFTEDLKIFLAEKKARLSKAKQELFNLKQFFELIP